MPTLLFVCPTTANIYQLFLDGFRGVTYKISLTSSKTYEAYFVSLYQLLLPLYRIPMTIIWV